MHLRLAFVAGLASVSIFVGNAHAGSIYTEDANWNYQAFNPFAVANGLTMVSSSVTAPYIYAATSSNDGATYIAQNGTPDASGDSPPGTTFTSLGALRLSNLYLPNSPFPGSSMTGVTGTSGLNGVDAVVVFALQGVSGPILAPGFQTQDFTKGAYVVLAVQGGSFTPGNLSTWGAVAGSTVPSNLLTAGVVAYGNLISPQSVLSGNPNTGLNTGYTDTPSPGAQAGNTDQVTSNGAGQFNGSAVASLSFTSTGSTPDLLTNISSFGNSGSTNPGLFLDNIAETANLGASLPAGQYTLANEIYNNIWAIAGLSGSPGYSASTTNLEESFNATFAVPDATPAVPEPPSLLLAWALIAVGTGGWMIWSRRKKHLAVDGICAQLICQPTQATANRPCKRAA